MPNPPDVSDKSSIIPAKVKVEGVGFYVEDLNTSVAKGSNLLEPFNPTAEDGEEGEGGEEEISRMMTSKTEDMQMGSVAPEEEEDEVENNDEPNWFQRWFCGKKAAEEEEGEREDDEIERSPSGGKGQGGRGQGGSGGNRFRRGWQADVNDNVEVKSVFAFDGRVPWRRLIAPYCRRRLYDVVEKQWVDDPEDSDGGLAEPAKRLSCRPDKDERREDEHHNFYQHTDLLGFAVPEIETRRGSSGALEAESDLIRGTADDEGPILTPLAPDGTRPSLRLKLSQLPNFHEVASQLNDVYHSYVLEPRALQVFLTLTMMPMFPNKPGTRCWSSWGESRRPPDVSFTKSCLLHSRAGSVTSTVHSHS